jgi:hypothetical protein
VENQRLLFKPRTIIRVVEELVCFLQIRIVPEVAKYHLALV